MCPGGTVVAASNEEQRIVVNGMSYSGRKAWWANSAIIVEVSPDDFDQADNKTAQIRAQDLHFESSQGVPHEYHLRK